MKTTILAILAAFTLVSCETVKQYSTPANARIGTALICSNVINLTVDAPDRPDVARDLYAVATVFHQFTGGHIPTPAELQAAIKLVTPKNANEWATLTTNICGIWAAIYPNIQGNSKLAIDYLEAISAGCSDSARSFLP